MTSVELILPALIIPSVLVLEAYFPADPNQKPLSQGFFQDSVWFVGNHLVMTYLVYPYYHVLTAFTQRVALTDATFWSELPFARQLVFSILLLDFFAWLGHIAMHKVPFLWNFHAVHHSQKEMNLFTDLRVHFVEYFVLYTLALLPLGLIGISPISVFAYSIFQQWYLIVYHANIRFNYGPLRALLVTPQSHRIHHSMLAKHRDRNYGVIFSIWDRMLGVQYRRSHEYPCVGIEDDGFPSANESSFFQILTTYFKQNMYPIMKSFSVAR